MGQSLSSWAASLANSLPHKDEAVDHTTLLLDMEHRIVAVSAGVSQMLRVAIADLVGRHVGEYLPILSTLSDLHDRRYPAGKKVRTHLCREHTLARRHDGTELPVIVSLFETREDGHLLLWLRHLHSEVGHFPLVVAEEARP